MRLAPAPPRTPSNPRGPCPAQCARDSTSLAEGDRLDDSEKTMEMASPVEREPSTAQKSFELNNHITLLDQDQIFRYDAAQQRAIQAQRPWKDNPRYFTKVRISAVALIKMVMHARSGGQYEIMGLMQGKIDGDTFVVMDSFALPVVGTETRVNAASEANEYMVEFLERSKTVGRLENAVGWYHSHPGYGCWLSGIDVATQLTNQTYTDPFVAIVIDPNRTVSAGRVDIGAFRTLPEHAISKTRGPEDEFQSVPLAKIEDFGAHANAYYALEIEHFKSALDGALLDVLWNKYWTNTLSQNPLLNNRAYTASQMQDVTAKLSKAEAATISRCSLACLNPRPTTSNANDSKGTTTTTTSKCQTQLAKVMRDVEKLEVQNQCGWFGQIIKQALFTRNQDGKLNLPLT